MLTGDKVETAHCIAISAGFKARKNIIKIMRELTEKFDAVKKLDEFKRQATNTVLLIDGQTIDLMFSDPNLEERFFIEACEAPAVCVCRCSPTQKALIT